MVDAVGHSRRIGQGVGTDLLDDGRGTGRWGRPDTGTDRCEQEATDDPDTHADRRPKFYDCPSSVPAVSLPTQSTGLPPLPGAMVTATVRKLPDGLGICVIRWLPDRRA